MASFADTYKRPDLGDVRQRVDALKGACLSAQTPEAFLGAVDQWNRLRATVDTQLNIALVRYNQDTNDQAAREEQAFWDASAPVLREMDVIHASTLLSSRFKGALDAKYGSQLSALKRCEQATFVPEIATQVAEEAALSTEYTEIMARPEVEFRGERMSLSKLMAFLDHADRQTRIDAQRAREAFLERHATDLDRIYGRMVELRHDMGMKLGDESYLPLAYRLRNRTSYGPDDVAAFRDAVVREIVPIASELHARQAATLGVPSLLFHDEPVWMATGNVRPVGGDAAILDGAMRMYRELHPDMGEFFDCMLEHQLLDVELRDGKAGGGFCTNFADLGLPFIFANFNGSDADIGVITHECGHAFQVYASRHVRPRVEYAFPTYEAAEIHSMGMEFLTFPWMELFFGDRAEAYRKTHIRRSICLLPYTTQVDQFQHDVYENPSLTPGERNQRWLELEHLYMPHRDYGGQYPHFATGTLWQRQRHIYILPFYFIDYALAMTCALQVWEKANQDRQRALDEYLAICRVGGSVSFLDMLELGGLRSPFDPDCMSELAAYLRSQVLE